MDDQIIGFVAPVHRALTEPILMGGAPRAVAILNGTWQRHSASVCAFGSPAFFSGSSVIWRPSGLPNAIQSSSRSCAGTFVSPVTYPCEFSHDEFCRVSLLERAPRGLSALGRPCRRGHCPQQGRLVSADSKIPGARSRQRGAGRTCCRLSAFEQRLASPRVWLGAVCRGSTPCRRGLSTEHVPGRGIRLGRRRAQGPVRGSRSPLRVKLLPDFGLSAPGRRSRSCGAVALRR